RFIACVTDIGCCCAKRSLIQSQSQATWKTSCDTLSLYCKRNSGGDFVQYIWRRLVEPKPMPIAATAFAANAGASFSEMHRKDFVVCACLRPVLDCLQKMTRVSDQVRRARLRNLVITSC